MNISESSAGADPSISWSGRSALVTGAAAGIGAAAAYRLAALEVPITLATLRPGEGAEEVLESIQSAGHKAQVGYGDVCDEAAVTQLVATATETFGPPDIVVHAAGGFQNMARVTDLDPADFDRIVAVNLRSTYLVMRAVLPGMIERGWGRFVTVASEMGRMPVRIGSPAYAASKAAVIGLTKHVAREVADTGVTVNATAPSTTLSPRVRSVYPDGGAAVAAQHPMRRLAEPDEQAAAIVFLCSPDASYVNGACLDVTGGAVNL
ncbi:SDR family NAD(P)-dependent oxidoreductase [Mycolicibacterium sp.]|uniref:SDR family NAD(P)-dependent oxidoreductase n=1 Tax=Mycolicibacterium sp. TaxID=2320850 RepID=UPI003D0E7803